MNTNTTNDYPIKTVKVELEFSLDRIRALLADQYPEVCVMSDRKIAEAIRAGFSNRYWESDLNQWLLENDPVFKKLMDAVWDQQ